MPSPPGRPEIQTVAGAAQFTGTTVADGLVQFDDFLAGNPPDQDQRIVLFSFGYFESGAGAATVLRVFLRPHDSTPATAVLELVNNEAIPNRTKYVSFGKNGLVVPRKQASPANAWDMVFVTTGKAADASIVIDWGIEPARTV